MEHIEEETIHVRIQRVFKKIKRYLDIDSKQLDIDTSAIQLFDFSNANEYSYLQFNTNGKPKNKNDRYYRILCYLQGAIKEKGNLDTSFLEIQKELQLLVGMFCFYDPFEIHKNDDKAYPYYLLGAMPKNKLPPNKQNLMPSLYFKWFNYNKDNNNYSDTDKNWLNLYKYFNAYTRTIFPYFKDDYPYFFSDDGKREKSKYEIENNLLYISSGEIDHGILQWLMRNLFGSSQINFDDEIEVNLNSIIQDIEDFTKKIIEEHLDKQANYLNIIKKICDVNSDNYSLNYHVEAGNSKSKATLFEWLKLFGLLNSDGTYSERLIASMHYFFQNKRFEMKKISFQYSEIYLAKFKELWTKYHTEKNDNNFELLITYLKTINTFSATDNSNEEVKNEKPEDILRFNVYTHFLQRYVIGCYDKKYLETTCRGLIAFPIQSNKENDEIKSKIPNVGYFYGIIQDSDWNGNCYGNYYSKRNNKAKKFKGVANFYKEQLYQLQSIAFNLGRIETQNIYYRGILEKHRKETEQQATRAAISQVMARNMSHNIGSHVLSRLTDGEILKGIRLGKFISFNSSINLYKKSDSYNKIVFDQLGIYNNYVKCRMDYLSDITFGTPLMHTDKKAFNEIYRDFDRVRLLLEFISGLSEFKYEIKFTRENDKGEIVPLSVNDDLTLALPNDVLGCQAFYNILENIIRNTAKHNQRKRRTTVFTINFKEIKLSSADAKLNEAKSIFYGIEVYDDIEIKGNKKFSTKEDKEQKAHYCKKKAANNRQAISNIDWLVYCQNEKINLSVLQDNNQLRNSSLGLLEMEASAAYLRKLDIIQIEADEYEVNHNEEIYNSNNNLNILKAFNKNGCLAYRFFISKPTEFLFVGEFEITETETLAKEGIWVMTEKQFACELKRNVVFNHQFVLHQASNTIKETLKDYKTNLPIRILEIELNSPVIDTLKTNFSFSKVEEWIWQEWFKAIKCTYENISVFKVYSSGDPYHNTTNCYRIALSHHEDRTTEICKTDFKKGIIQSYDVISTNAKSKLPYAQEDFVTYLDDIKKQFVPKAKLFEAAMNSIVVIDERIQRYSKETYMKLLNKEIFSYTNIQMPYDVDLAKENFTNELTEKIENFISVSISLCQNKFLLIHYSILERMYGGSDKRKEKIESKLIEWSEHIRVVVTSGRGKPPELPSKNVCYVNLSPVLNAFTHARSKYAINYLLNTARK